jgi:hypothetical protein
VFLVLDFSPSIDGFFDVPAGAAWLGGGNYPALK